MAFKAKDGSPFTNIDAMKRHDAKSAAKPPAKQMNAPEPDEEGEGDEAEQVVQEHGPAHTIGIQHQDESGQHHVHSVHADGHMHQSVHGSREEAHDYARKLGSGENDGQNLAQMEQYDDAHA